MKHTTHISAEGRVLGRRRVVIICALIVLVGFNLRSVILAVPPILPLIQHALGLSYTATGLLIALPTLALAGAAWPSGLVTGRIGGRAAVTIGLLLLGVGTLLRAFMPTTFSLYLFTLLLSLGITISQTAMPVLIRRWFPERIGLVAALFSDGLIIGEATAAGVTATLMSQVLGASTWAATFVFWSVPVAVVLVLWLLLAPPAPPYAPYTPSAEHEATAKPLHNMTSDKRTPVSALHLGTLIGAGSLIYFGMNAWIAPYNQAIHHESLTPLTLTILSAAQLPVSLLMTPFAQQLAGRRSPFVVVGIVCSVAIVGWMFTPAVLEPLWAALLGGSSALVFMLGIALPPLLAGPKDVARLTGSTVSLNYTVAFVGPFVGGSLWDLFHLPILAFLPVVLAGIILIVLGLLLPSYVAFKKRILRSAHVN